MGTLAYFAPELLTGRLIEQNDFSLKRTDITLEEWMKTDLWAFGAVIVELLICQPLIKYVAITKNGAPKNLDQLPEDEYDGYLNAALWDIRGFGIEPKTIEEIVATRNRRAIANQQQSLSAPYQQELIELLTNLLQRDPKKRHF